MPNDDQHPFLTEEQDRTQRGDDPAGSFGRASRPSGDLDPNWRPDEDTLRLAEELAIEVGHEQRPRREDVYPYLLVRAYSPGDRGARPVPPDQCFYLSPDILLVDAAYTGPFTPARLVASPLAGRTYRVFVRVWNLGLLPAVGVHVRAWWIVPGFFTPSNPAYSPELIGGAMVNLDDRTGPGAMQVVELDATWTVPQGVGDHLCLLASASCPLDPWSGAFDALHDRHVGQRNLAVLPGGQSAKDLLHQVGGLVHGGILEVRHGGAAALPLLQGVLGRNRREFAWAELTAPDDESLHRGVATASGRHLASMLRTDRGWLVVDSGRLWGWAEERGVLRRWNRRRGANPFDDATGVQKLVDAVGPDAWEEVGVLVDGDPADALLEGLVRVWELDDLDAAGLARAQHEPGPFADLLRFEHTDAETGERGGYGVVLLP